MALLSRVAEQLYWAARYLERAEDTVRIVRAYTDVIVDLPTSVVNSWEPLLAVTGTTTLHRELHDEPDEASIVLFLVADESERELRRELHRACAREPALGKRGACRRRRGRWSTTCTCTSPLTEPTGSAGAADRDSRNESSPSRNGSTASSSATMSRDHAYEFLRIGQAIERADMTTRVLGVRAAALVGGSDDSFAEVQWMGVLRSLSALQMYQLATRSPIDGEAVIDFLLHDRAFPRSVMSCLLSIRDSMSRLPRGDQLGPVLAEVFSTAAQVERRRARWRRARRRDRNAADRAGEAERCHHRDLCRRPRLAIDCRVTKSNPDGYDEAIAPSGETRPPWQSLSRADLTPQPGRPRGSSPPG